MTSSSPLTAFLSSYSLATERDLVLRRRDERSERGCGAMRENARRSSLERERLHAGDVPLAGELGAVAFVEAGTKDVSYCTQNSRNETTHNRSVGYDETRSVLHAFLFFPDSQSTW